MDSRALALGQFEQVVIAGFLAEKVAAYVADSKVGPHTYTYAMKCYHPEQAGTVNTTRLAKTIEHAVNIDPVRINQRNGAILVEIPTPYPEKVHAVNYAGQGLDAPLGINSLAKPFGIDFRDDPHAIFVGPTRCGKTNTMRALAYQLAKASPARTVGFTVICAGSKAADWAPISRLLHTWATVIEPGEVEGAAAYFAAVSDGRERWQPNYHMFLFVDDLMAVMGAANVLDNLAHIASIGASRGVHLVVGTQMLGSSGAGAKLERNIRTRLVFGTTSAADAALFTGRKESGAERIGRYKGDALLITGEAMTRIATGYIADEDFAVLPSDATGRDVRPWLEVVDDEPARPAECATEPPAASSDALTPTLENKPASRPARSTGAIVEAYGRTGSVRAVALELWGYSNSDIRRKIKMAVGL